MTSTHTLTKDPKLSSVTVFVSTRMNEVTDDFYFDKSTIRADFSNTASLMTSSSGPSLFKSAGPDFGTTTLSQSYSFRQSAKQIIPTVREKHSFMQKIQPTETSQQRSLSSNINTVKLATQFASAVSMVILSSRTALSTTGELHLSTPSLSLSNSFRHIAKDLTSTTLTGSREMSSFTQNIRAAKTSQQRLSSSNSIDFEVSDDFYFDTVSLVTRFASTVSIVSLSSRPALSTSGGLHLITTRFSQSYYFRHSAKELASSTLTASREMLYSTQNIQATKASQQRTLSSNTIGFEVSDDIYSSKVILSSHFTSAHAVSMVILSSSPGLHTSDGLILSGNKSSFTKEVPETGRRETRTIQPARTSQQRMFSSDATGSKGN